VHRDKHGGDTPCGNDERAEDAAVAERRLFEMSNARAPTTAATSASATELVARADH
jgi:hypothetical protein